MNSLMLEKRYVLKWQLKNYPNYKISICRNIINTKTNRLIKRTVVGTTKGYWIGKKFIPINKLNQYCEIINKNQCPF
jgi:hypothetical protein